MDYFGQKLKKQEVLSRIGNISQLAGAQRMVITEGKGKDLSIIRIRNGRGLDFTILPDRALDIFEAFYKGAPLAWISNNGLVNGTRFDDREAGWLKTFGGGLLVTCGLRNVGSPCTIGNEHFGLHGRISSIPTENISLRSYWKNDDFFTEISGEIRECKVFGENLVCYRTITVSSELDSIRINDRIINEGFKPDYLALLYHFNLGSPLLEEKAEFQIDTENTAVRDLNADSDSWNQFSSPQPGYKEVVYLHKPLTDQAGIASCVFLSHKTGLKVGMKWDGNSLPYLTQWKMLGQGEYVSGIEPGNCFPMGRENEIKQNRMTLLQGFEEISVSLELEIGTI